MTPFNANAAKDAERFDQFLGPTPGYVEQVYLMQPIADKKDMVNVLLHNEKKDVGCLLSYGAKALPHLTLWKNTGAVVDGYVVGIEPGTSFPNRRAVERKAGRVPKLEAGGRHETTLRFQLLEGKTDVADAEAEVRRAQGKRDTVIEKTP